MNAVLSVIAWIVMISGLALGGAHASIQDQDILFRNTDLFLQGFEFENPDKRANLPGPLDTLVEEVTGWRDFSYSPGCRITASKMDDVTKLFAYPGKCRRKPSLKMVLGTILPEFNIDKASSQFICSDCYFFDTFKYEKKSKQAEFRGSSKMVIRVMNPAYFYLRNTNITVTFNTDQLDVNLVDLDIVMVGLLSIKGHHANMIIRKPTGKKVFSFDLAINNVLLRDLGELFGIFIDEMTEPTSAFSVALYRDIGFENPRIKGIFEIARTNNDAVTLQMVARANVFNSQPYQRAKMFLVVNKARGLPARGAIIAAVPKEYNVLTQLKKFLLYKEYIPDLSMIRKINRDYLIIVSQEDMVLIKDSEFIQLLSPYMNEYDTYQLRKGASVQVLTPMKKNLENCSSTIKTNVEERDVLVTILVKTSGLEYKYPENFKSNFVSMIKCIADGLVKVPTPMVEDDNQLIQFKDIAFGMGRRLTVTAVVKGPFKLASGNVIVKDIQLQVERIKNETWTWKISGKATVNIKSMEINVTIEKDDQDYTITGSIDSLMLHELKNVTGNIYFFQIVELFGPLKDFGIKDLKVIAKFGSEKSLRIVGRPILFGITELNMEVIIYKQGAEGGATAGEEEEEEGKKEGEEESKKEGEGEGDNQGGEGGGGQGGRNQRRVVRQVKKGAKRQEESAKSPEKNALVVGILFREVQLSTLLEKVCGRPVLSEGWMNKMTAYIIISNVDDEETKFTLTDLADVEIAQGLSIHAKFRVPSDCKGNSLCQFLQDKIGLDATFYIGGRIAKVNGKWLFELVAGVEGTFTLIPKRLTLRKAEIKILINGKDSKIELSCELQYENLEKNIQLRFRGAISVSVSGELSLEFTMAGMWLQPFGVQYIGVGNLLLGIGYQPGAPLPSFEFGGELWIGKIDPGKDAKNENIIKVRCYVGFSPDSPEDNYVFGSIKKLTIELMLLAFGYDVSIPKAVRESGFPDGMTVSFTSNPDGKKIEGLDDKNFIPAGFYLKGAINILGYLVSAEITVSPTEIKVDVALSPLRIANGLIVLQRSEYDKRNGPKCFIQISEETVKVYIEGYISILGMTKYVLIDIDDSGFRFNITSDMFGILRTELFVSAYYGDLNSVGFEFKGKLKFSMAKIAEEIKRFLDSVNEMTQKSLDRAKKSLFAAEKKVDGAKGKINAWKSDLTSFRQRNKRRIEELERKKAAMETDCKANCGEVCVGFLDWKAECFKIWWWWVGCPCWNPCRWKVPDLLCITKCELTKAFNKIGASIEQFGLKIVNAVSQIGDFVLNLGDGILDIGKKVLGMARGILTGVQAIVKVGVEIGKAIATIVLKDLLEIRRLDVSGSLDSNLTACVGLDCDVTLLGLRITFNSSICINLDFYNSLASLISSKKYPGVDKVEQKLQEEEDRYKDLDSKEDLLQSEVDKGENKVNSDVRSAEKKSQIPSLEEREASGYNPFPDFVMKRSDIMEILSFSSPWALADRVVPESLATLPAKSNTTSADKRTFEINENSQDSCLSLRNVISRYDDIANGLRTTYRMLKDQRKMHKAYDDSFAKGVEEVKRDLDHIEKKYNITREEREDIRFWYDTVKEGHEKWQMKSNNVLRYQRRNAIPTLKVQLDYIFKKTFDQDTSDYLRSLHTKASNAIKRSLLGSIDQNSQEELRGVGRTLAEIIENPTKAPSWGYYKTREVQARLRGLKDTISTCRQRK